MSKQLAVSAALSVLAMAGFALGIAPAMGTGDSSATAHFGAKAVTSGKLPSLPAILPSLR